MKLALFAACVVLMNLVIQINGTKRVHECERRAGSCYKVMMDRDFWPDAKKRCEELGGYLASVESEQEQHAVVDLIEQSIAREPTSSKICENVGWSWNGGKVYHIGARRATDSCSAKFVWEGPGSKQTDVHYTNWRTLEPEQPSCSGNIEFCVQVVQGNDWKWNDINCGINTHGYGCSVCEFDQ